MRKLLTALLFLLMPCTALAQPLTPQQGLAVQQDILDQLTRCFNALIMREFRPPKAKVFLDIDVEPDGRVTFVGFTEPDKYNNNPYYRQVADIGLKAIQSPSCIPLKNLPPPDQMQYLKHFTVIFSSY